MRYSSLHTPNKLITPASGTTIYVDYSSDSSILEIAYSGGHVYHYYNVPKEVWQEYRQIILTGGSSGTFANTRIKPLFLKYKRIK